MAKVYTNLEQSKRLEEFLPIESADGYWFKGFPAQPYMVYTAGTPNPGEHIPCWSLAALFDVLPEGVINNYYVPNLQKENGKYSIAYGDEELLCIADNPIDTCYEMIMKLHEQKLL